MSLDVKPSGEPIGVLGHEVAADGLYDQEMAEVQDRIVADVTSIPANVKAYCDDNAWMVGRVLVHCCYALGWGQSVPVNSVTAGSNKLECKPDSNGVVSCKPKPSRTYTYGGSGTGSLLAVGQFNTHADFSFKVKFGSPKCVELDKSSELQHPTFEKCP